MWAVWLMLGGEAPTGSNMSAVCVSSSTAIRDACKRAAFLVDGLLPAQTGTVVLAYHRVGGRTSSPVDMPTSMFERQMAHLRALGSVLPIDVGLRRLVADSARPGSAPRSFDGDIVLTFDDGTADFADEVMPHLLENDLPATIYVATSHVDDQVEFPGGAKPLSWNALRDCVSTGLVTVGAHTHTHALLDRCDPMTIDTELDICNDRIATELGIEPQHFAYPKAIAGNPYAERAVRRRYRSAAVAGTRTNRPGATNPWHLRRSPIQNADEWPGFLRKLEGGMRVEDDVRSLINTVRYRRRTS